LIDPVASNTPFLKNDSTALFLSAFGVLFAHRYRTRLIFPFLAAIFCFLSFSAKQSCLASSASCFVFFALHRKSGFSAFVVTWVASFIIFFALASAGWGKGFWFSIFSAPNNPLSLAQFRWGWSAMFKDPVFLGLLVFSLGSVVVRKICRKEIASNPFTYYMVFSWGVVTLTVAKMGSSTNHFIEPVLATLMWLTSRVNTSTPSFSTGRLRWALIVGGFIVLGLAASRPLPAFTNPARTSHIKSFQYIFTEEMRNLGLADKKILNLDSAPLGYFLGENSQVNDPFLYSLLWIDQKLDVGPLRDAVASQYFDAILLPEDTSLIDSSPLLSSILSLINKHYPVRKRVLNLTLAFPIKVRGNLN
jgi:hypothetical protein